MGACPRRLPRLLPANAVTAAVDHTPQPHPASPTNTLPESFSERSSHASFSSYRDHAQQFGPLRKTIKDGVGAVSGVNLGPVAPPKGVFFDRNELPARFRRAPLTAAEIELVETGGAAAFA